MTDPEPTHVTDDVQVTDVFVKANHSSANPPELFVLVDGIIPQDTFEPVEGDPDDSMWVSENPYGVFAGWQTSLPVSEETGAGMQTASIQHSTLGEVDDRYRSLDHVVAGTVNDENPWSVFSVRFIRGVGHSPQSYPIRVELGQELLDKYVNGPLGASVKSWQVYARDIERKYSWHGFVNDRADYDQYEAAEWVLVKDSIYTWHPLEAEKAEADDYEIYE